MIKSTMAMFPRTLLWLICFALFCLMPGCGGSGGGGEDGEAVTYSLAITTTPDLTTFQSGETVTIIATVTGSDGLAASGYAVTFTIFRNNSGGTLTIAGTGTTDGDGRAQATYTLGPNDSADAVTDTIEVSIPGSSETITVNRSAGTAVQDTIANLDLAAAPTSIKTDGTSKSTITVNALSTGNALINGATIALSSDTGVLSDPSVTTPGTVTFSSGGPNNVGNKFNRIATITATAGEVTTNILVRITGSTLDFTSSATSLSVGGQATLTVVAKDAAGTAVKGAEVTLESSSPNASLDKVSGTTDENGTFTSKLTATAASATPVIITAEALGVQATNSITINPSATQVFEISKTTRYSYLGGVLDTTDRPDLAWMQFTSTTSDTLEVEVNVPSGNNVTFATTMGNWTTSGTKTQSVAVNPATRKATATLTTNRQAGIANIQVYLTSAPATSDTMAVTITSTTPHHISVESLPSVISTSVGTTTGSTVLLASVRDAVGQPVGGAPVLFEIVKPTGGGETISPVVVLSATTTTGGLHLGDARTTFTSGSLESTAKGVQVRASVVGYDIHTGEIEDKNDDGIITPPSTDSGIDAAVVITERAASIAFGQATSLGVDETNSNYKQEMSVIVTDISGKGINGATVILSIWPIAWNTGEGCGFDPDGLTWNPVTEAYDIICPTCGTFWNEDFRNENVWLDAGEDGLRCYYADPTGMTCIGGGKGNGSLTPPSAAAGTVVSLVEGEPIKPMQTALQVSN